MADYQKQLNLLEIMGLKRSHYHRSIDSTTANDITVPTVNAYQQFDSPTTTRVIKQFANNIERLTKYIVENGDAINSTNLSNYITTDIEDEDGLNKIFVTAPCSMTSQRMLDIKKCMNVDGESMPPMLATFMFEDTDKENNLIIGVTKNNTIVRYNLGPKTSFVSHPSMETLYIKTANDNAVFKRAGFADPEQLYIYVITDKDIRLFKVNELCNLSRGKSLGDITYSNIVDFANSYSDDHKSYNDNLFIEDIFRTRRKNILNLITSKSFHSFIDKYFKIGSFPENVLDKTYYSIDPVQVYDVGIVTGKYGVYLLHCYSSKPKNINEFEQDYPGDDPSEARGSLHIRCLDDKPVKDAFFYKDHDILYLIAINGWPKSAENDVAEYDIADNQYKGVTVFRIDEESSSSMSYKVPIPEQVYSFTTTVGGTRKYFYTIDTFERDKFTMANKTWTRSKVFKTYSIGIPGTIPIYRWYNVDTEDYYYTKVPGEKSGQPLWKNETLIFYVFDSDGLGRGRVSSIMPGLEGSIYVPMEVKLNAGCAEDYKYILDDSASFKAVDPDGWLESENYGVRININQFLDSRGINGAYVNNLKFKECKYNKLILGVDTKGFLVTYQYRNPNPPHEISNYYWFVEASDQRLCSITKDYTRNEFNCLAEYKIKNAAFDSVNNIIVFDIKGIGLVQGHKEYDRDGKAGFRFQFIQDESTYGKFNIMLVMNRCFVALSDTSIYFITTNGKCKIAKLGEDVFSSAKKIEFATTNNKTNALCIGDNGGSDDSGFSRFSIITLKFKIDVNTYTELITQNLGNLISTNFLTQDNGISKEIDKHIRELHGPDSVVTKLNSIMAMVQSRSIPQATGFSDNIRVSYIILNYPNNGNDFSYIETDENSTDVYGRINSKTVNANPFLMTVMNRNSNAITYYDTVTDSSGNVILSTNKLTYSSCRLSDKMTRLTVNVPSTGTYYVDNILGWSNGSRTGSSLSRKSLDEGYIQGQIEDCVTHYQLILNGVYFNIRNILNVTAQIASAPLRIYSNTSEFDVRHYGMYDSPVIAPINMNSLTDNYIYDMSASSNDEIVLSFSVFGGDALQINILIENNE